MTSATWKDEPGLDIPDNVTDRGLAQMDRWQEDFAGSGARLMVVAPVMLDGRDHQFLARATWERIERIRARMATSKAPLHCDPITAVFSSVYRYNTNYHSNAEGARLRTAELSHCINDFLNNKDVRSAPIVTDMAVQLVRQRFVDQTADFGRGAMPLQVRLRNITAINEAIADFHRQNGHYPRPSQNAERDDLQELAAALKRTLPTDPVGPKDENYYAYFSDGKGYKIAAFAPAEDCTVVAANWPNLIDPARIKRGDATECRAYGYWTKDFEMQ